jgi:hypothetical protein
MSEEKRKPTIDERLEALTHSLELMALDIEVTREEQQRLDRRERAAREALLTGIAAYLRALGAANGDDPA